MTISSALRLCEAGGAKCCCVCSNRGGRRRFWRQSCDIARELSPACACSSLTSKKTRRLLEEDLQLSKGELDEHKDLITETLDKVRRR